MPINQSRTKNVISGFTLFSGENRNQSSDVWEVFISAASTVPCWIHVLIKVPKARSSICVFGFRLLYSFGMRKKIQTICFHLLWRWSLNSGDLTVYARVHLCVLMTCLLSVWCVRCESNLGCGHFDLLLCVLMRRFVAEGQLRGCMGQYHLIIMRHCCDRHAGHWSRICNGLQLKCYVRKLVSVCVRNIGSTIYEPLLVLLVSTAAHTCRSLLTALASIRRQMEELCFALSCKCFVQKHSYAEDLMKVCTDT